MLTSSLDARAVQDGISSKTIDYDRITLYIIYVKLITPGLFGLPGVNAQSPVIL